MGLNNAEIKKANRNNIFRYLLKVDIVSKNDIGIELRLTAPTVASSLKNLIDLGLVKEEGVMDSNGGRKSMGYKFDRESKYAIGVNITKNYIDLAIVDLTMKPVYTKHVKKQIKGNDETYQWLKNFILESIAEADIADEKILGVGYALPAIIDESGTKIYGLHEEMDLTYTFYEIAEKLLPFKTILRREAICAGFAVASNMNLQTSTIYLNIAPSIGGAIIHSNLQTRKGINCRAGEFGHLTLFPNGKTCFCGRSGCMNAYCSSDVLSSMTDGDLSEFFDQLPNNEKFKNIWETYTDNLALAIHNLMTSFDEHIILGGNLAKYLPPYIDTIIEKVVKYDPYLKNIPFLRIGSLEFDAASIGAAGYFIENYIQNI